MSGNGWSGKSIALVQPGATVAGVTTDAVATRAWPITAGGALNCVIKLSVSNVTKVGNLTAKLQTAIGNDWVDSKTADITADGNYYIKLQAAVAGDQTYLPLLNSGRIVLSADNAGDEFTLDTVDVLQPL